MRQFIFLTLLCFCGAVQAQNNLYADTDVSGARFGATVGAGASWRSPYARPADGSLDFGGKAALSCSGIDFNAFLSTFNSGELLTELRQTIVGSARAVVSNYLIALAYSNPTIASVLDMVDQRYSARFNAFAQQCNASMARRRGESEGARQMAEAQDQCFSAKINAGGSPTEAYRQCSRASTFGGMNLPAAAPLQEFMTRYSSIDVTREIEIALKLLPDSRTSGEGVQMKPPTLTVTAAKANVEDRVINALTDILNGTNPNDINDCAAEAIATPVSGRNDRCIPVSAGALVRSPAFLSARFLSAAEQTMYVGALSEQIAAVEIRARIVHLRQELSRLTPKPGADVQAEDVSGRREALLKEVARLESDAHALETLTAAKAQIARTQILAMQRASARLDATRSSATRASLNDSGAFVGGMRTLFGLRQ